MAKIALITGGTSGIGLQTAQALSAAGWTVYTLSRRGTGPEGMIHLTADVTCPAQVDAAVQQVIVQQGQLDLVVNCAGFGIAGAVEFTDTDLARQLFDVNFFGMVQVNRAALPHLRRSGGRIILVSSVAAVVPIPFQTYYSAAKAAMNSYTMALANECRSLGVSVCAVMPGDLATGFTAARKTSLKGDDIYGGRIRRSVEKMEQDEAQGMDPAVIARRIAVLAEKRRVRPLYTVGAFYHVACLLAKLLPCGVLNRLIGLLYSR